MLMFHYLQRHKNAFDLLRLLLAMAVIVGHGPRLNGDTGFFFDPFTFLIPGEYFGSIAVKLFLFMSGIFVTNSLLQDKNPLRFVTARFFRIMPNLLLVLLVAAFVVGPMFTTLSLHAYFSNKDVYAYVAKNLIFHTDFTLPGTFAGNFYPEAVNGSLWTLGTEVGCYLFLLGLFLLASKLPRTTTVLNLLCAVIIGNTLFFDHSFFPFLGTNSEVNLLPSAFCLGALVAINKERLVIDLKTPVALFLVAFVLNTTAYYHLLAVSGLCFLMLYIFTRPVVVNLNPKRDISYGVYVWGFLVQQTLVALLGTINVYGHIALALVVTCLLALVGNYLVETPGMQLGKKLMARVTGTPSARRPHTPPSP